MSCRRAGYRRATNLRLSAHRCGKHSASFREARPVPFDVVKVVEAMIVTTQSSATRNWRQSSGHSGNQAPLLPTYSSSLQTDLMPCRASGSICCESTSDSAGNEANRGRCSRTSESFRKSPSVPTLSGCWSRATRRAAGTPGPSPSTCSRESTRSLLTGPVQARVPRALRHHASQPREPLPTLCRRGLLVLHDGAGGRLRLPDLRRPWTAAGGL